MNRVELIDAMVKETGLSKKDAEKALAAFKPGKAFKDIVNPPKKAKK